MNTRPSRPQDALPDDVPSTAPQTTPKDLGYGHPEYHFVQSIMEMQKSLGEINASIIGLRQAVDGIKSKVDDLVAWKHKILGGAAVFGALLALLGFAVTKFSNYITLSPPAEPPPVIVAPATPQQASPATHAP